MAPKHLNFITGNANKLAEVAAILSDTGVEFRNQNVDLPELQGSIEEITRDKCSRAADVVCVSLHLRRYVGEGRGENGKWLMSFIVMTGEGACVGRGYVFVF